MLEIAKCLEHSSPDVRDGAANAKEKLEAGAGGRADPSARPSAVATSIAAGFSAAAAPAEVLRYAGDVGAAWLESELGGAVNSTLFDSAPAKLAALLAEELAGYQAAAPGPTAAAATAAVGVFRTLLSASAQSILADDARSYALDVQNCILAFAGRVLLKGCDLRFERGHRYGIVGQNGNPNPNPNPKPIPNPIRNPIPNPIPNPNPNPIANPNQARARRRCSIAWPPRTSTTSTWALRCTTSGTRSPTRASSTCTST
jgi:hypothetical protein